MNKTVFYRKQGRRYIPVSEYDSDLMDSFSQGNHLVMSVPGGSSRRFNIDPNFAAMIAAGHFAEDAICAAMVKADQVRPPRPAMTVAEIDAWNNLIEVWGDEARSLTRPAIRDVAEAGVKAMMEEADKLMKNEIVRKAYEHFLTVAALTKDHE